MCNSICRVQCYDYAFISRRSTGSGVFGRVHFDASIGDVLAGQFPLDSIHYPWVETDLCCPAKEFGIDLDLYFYVFRFIRASKIPSGKCDPDDKWTDSQVKTNSFCLLCPYCMLASNIVHYVI